MVLLSVGYLRFGITDCAPEIFARLLPGETFFTAIATQSRAGGDHPSVAVYPFCIKQICAEDRALAYLDWVQWPAMLVTVLAAWLIGSQRPQRRMSGFVCFSLSNLLWVIWGVQAGAYALIVLQLCLFLMNLRGFMKNRVLER